MTKKVLFLSGVGFLLIGFVVLAGPQSISIDSRVDKSTITIGDRIRYTVELRHSPAIEVQRPAVAENLGAFEIKDYTPHDPVEEDGEVIERVDYIISTFEVGEFEIPPLLFHYVIPGDSTRHELRTRKIKIVVASMKPSEAGDVRGIKVPHGLQEDYRKIIIWSSIALAFLVLVAISFYIWRRRKAGKGILPQKVEPPRPAHEIALEELTALKASSLLAEGRVKAYYSHMSDIIRRYIEGRYFIVALEMTTRELIEELQNAEVEDETIALIQEFLAVCDLVKFAKYQPGAKAHDATFDKAFNLVQRTKLIYDVVFDDVDGEDKESGQAPPASENEATHSRTEEIAE
ncbi:MAG: hypothetical protein ACE5IY_05325 [bacterium]